MSASLDFLQVIYSHTDPETSIKEFRSFPNINGEGRPARLMTSDGDKLETFVERYDGPGRGIYYGVATRKTGSVQGRREDLAEIAVLWVDIDTEKLGLDRDDVVRVLINSGCPVSIVNDSGHGLHGLWRLNEAIGIDLKIDSQRADGVRVEAVLRQLAHVFAGDINTCDLSRVLRLPGTMNTKSDPAVVCSTVYSDGPEHDLTDLEDWLAVQSPLIAVAEGVSRPVVPNSFESYGLTYGGDYKPPMDVEEALDAMTYQGDGDVSIHGTQLRVSMSLLNKGWAEDDIVALLLERTALAVDDAGRFWNWDAEEAGIRKMVASGRGKIGDKVRNIADSKVKLEFEAKDPNWSDQLARDGRKEIKGSLLNLSLMLGNLWEFQDGFWLNDWSSRIVSTDRLPWRSKVGEMTDHDELEVRSWLARKYGVDFSAVTAHDGIVLHAHQNRKDPLLDYLDTLEWDGEARMDSWLTRVCGTENSRYVSAVGRMFLVSAVKRAYSPGCKADDIVILEGAQGIGKSTLPAKLVPIDDLFTDTHFDVSKSKEIGEALQGKWIVELPELSVVRRADQIERIKGFASARVDRFRPAYGRNTIDQPRRCVFIGTTNEDEYLQDITGNRRFWPVRLEHVNLGLLSEIRDQLWAEAVEAVRAGEPWWITDEEVAKAADQGRLERQETSAWDAYVRVYETHEVYRLAETDRLQPVDKWPVRDVPLEEIFIDVLIEEIRGVQDATRVTNWERKSVKRALQKAGFKEHRVSRKDQRRVWRRDEPLAREPVPTSDDQEDFQL